MTDESPILQAALTDQASRLVSCLGREFYELKGILIFLAGFILLAIGFTNTGKGALFADVAGVCFIIFGGNRITGD